MKLVVDASVALGASGRPDGYELFGGQELLAPSLMWSEATSALHAQCWRGELRPDVAERMRNRLAEAPVRRVRPRGLHAEAWRLADELGWAKTYDSEYLAVASLLGGRVVTIDGRLRRGAGRLGLVVLPTEL